MVKIALKVLFGLALCGACVYLALHSNLLDRLEGANLDGSNSITWHSEVVLALLILVCQLISFWAFRNCVVLTTCLGISACILGSYLLFDSKFGFFWEPHNADGTFPLTWRSNLFVITLLSGSLGLAFLTRWFIRRLRHECAASKIAHPNI